MMPTYSKTAIDRLICSALRGEAPPWPREVDGLLESGIAERSRYHGVSVLLNERMAEMPSWPASLREVLMAEAVTSYLWEEQHRRIVGEALDALARAGIPAVVMKGTALAYTLYGDPAWRRRADSDIIVAEEHGGRAAEALLHAGFRRTGSLDMALASHQDEYIKDLAGNRHAIDLHRRLANSEVVARALSFEELSSAACPHPALGAHGLTAGAAHALAIACLHRAIHMTSPYYFDGAAYHDGDRLIWLYDIHLLAASLSEAEWEALVDLAQRKGLGATCRDGLNAASARFGTRFPIRIRAALDRQGEPLARYLAKGSIGQGWMDLVATRGTSRRLRFLSELILPPRDYMRAKYKNDAIGWLPWLYGRRAVAGIARRLRQGSGS